MALEKNKWIGDYHPESFKHFFVVNEFKRILKLENNSVLNVDIEAGASACLFFNDYSGVVTEINVNLNENSSCELYGLFKSTNEKTHVITHITHKGNNSKAIQDFRFVNKESISSFKGLITIPENITGCESHMSNKNLLLDKVSKAYAKPELDIRCSDVICTHGSTTGTLDKEQLFYMQSRGLSYRNSVNMLIEAFYSDIKDKMTFND